MKVAINERTGEGGGHEVWISVGERKTLRYIIPIDGKMAMVNPFGADVNSVYADTFNDALKEAIKSVDF